MIKHFKELQQTIKQIKTVCEDVYEELGPGFDEIHYQDAMGLEFTNINEFEAIREFNIEVFYKNHFLTLNPIDFVILPNDNNQGYPLPIYLETKVLNAHEKPDTYDQLRRYIQSFAKSNNSIINKIEVTMLVTFNKSSVIETPNNVLADRQYINDSKNNLDTFNNLFQAAEQDGLLKFVYRKEIDNYEKNYGTNNPYKYFADDSTTGKYKQFIESYKNKYLTKKGEPNIDKARDDLGKLFNEMVEATHKSIGHPSLKITYQFFQYDKETKQIHFIENLD